MLKITYIQCKIAVYGVAQKRSSSVVLSQAKELPVWHTVLHLSETGLLCIHRHLIMSKMKRLQTPLS